MDAVEYSSKYVWCIFGIPLRAHTDELIPLEIRERLMEELVSQNEASGTSNISCDWTLQRTMLAAIQSPPVAGEKFGLNVWRHTENSTLCPGTCMDHQELSYEEGSFLLFPSQYLHMPFPWTVAHKDSLDLTPRILMVAFVIPCQVNGQQEYEIIGSLGR